MHLLVFGLGYTASRLAHRLRSAGWQVTATSRSGSPGTHAINSPYISAALRSASHILSSAPPADGVDPVLSHHNEALATAAAGWVGYLSSTGVYGDTGGAWVDETAALSGRRTDRIAADRAWQALRPDVRVFRLPGIYGPSRSALDQLRRNTAHRVDAPSQRFSRIHVDDIVSAIYASFRHGPPGVYNLADAEPAAGRYVTEYAADLIGVDYPPLIGPESPALSAMARGFYTESRVVTAAKAARLIGFTPVYPNYRAGLRACLG